MKLFFFLFFSLTPFISSAATLADLPKPILEVQHFNAKQGVCETRWPELVQSLGIIKDDLGDGATLWIVPCAHWSANVGYAVYVTIVESSHPDGFLTKPIHFVSYHPYEGIVSRELIHNILWDSANKTLKAQYFMNGSELCGSKSEYKWHGGYQTLQLKTLLKKNDCRDAAESWKPVFNP